MKWKQNRFGCRKVVRQATVVAHWDLAQKVWAGSAASNVVVDDDENDNDDDDDGDMIMEMLVMMWMAFADYTDHQFQGVIRRLRVNKRPVQLSIGRTRNMVQVWHCSAEEVKAMIAYLKQQKNHVHN